MRTMRAAIEWIREHAGEDTKQELLDQMVKLQGDPLCECQHLLDLPLNDEGFCVDLDTGYYWAVADTPNGYMMLTWLPTDEGDDDDPIITPMDGWNVEDQTHGMMVDLIASDQGSKLYFWEK